MSKDTLIDDLIKEIKTRKTEIENTLLAGNLEKYGSDYYTGKLVSLMEILIWLAENRTKSV